MLKNLKLNKKTVIIMLSAVAVLIIISVSAAFLGRSAARNRDSTPPQPPASYFGKSENLSSVTDVVGERAFEEIAEEPAETSSENSKETSAADSTQAVENETAEAASGEASEEKGDNIERYAYVPAESVDTDVSAYMDYLKSEKNFLDITGEDDNTEEDDTAKVYRLVGPSQDEKYHLEIMIEADEDRYTLTARKIEESWNSYVSGLWTKEKEKEANRKPEEAVSSMEMAQEAVRSLGEARLNLPKPVDQYDFRAGMGLVNVDGRDYYKVGTYERQENGTVTYECAYLVDYDSGAVVYKYNDATDEKESLE